MKSKKDIIVTEENEEEYRNFINCQFCEKNYEFDEVLDHCHLTGKYRDPAHNACIIHVTQDKKIKIPFNFHNFSNYDCHLFF